MFRALNTHLKNINKQSEVFLTREELMNQKQWLYSRATHYYINEKNKKIPSPYNDRFRNASNAINNVIKLRDYITDNFTPVMRILNTFSANNKEINHSNVDQLIDLITSNFQSTDDYNYSIDKLRRYYHIAEKSINRLEKTTESRISNVNDYSLYIMKSHLEIYKSLMLLMDSFRKFEVII